MQIARAKVGVFFDLCKRREEKICAGGEKYVILQADKGDWTDCGEW